MCELWNILGSKAKLVDEAMEEEADHKKKDLQVCNEAKLTMFSVTLQGVFLLIMIIIFVINSLCLSFVQMHWCSLFRCSFRGFDIDTEVSYPTINYLKGLATHDEQAQGKKIFFPSRSALV